MTAPPPITRQRPLSPAQAVADEGVARGDARDAALDHDQLLAFAELLFFAYRDFTAEPDEALAALGFGRAHHRVVHFVARRPGLRVADLLDTLKITKQSLAPVLKQLQDQGYIDSRPGDSDRRERLLYPTPRGEALAATLIAPQLARLGAALDAAHAYMAPGDAATPAGPSSASGIVAAFLRHMSQPRVIDDPDHSEPIAKTGGTP